MRAFFFVYGIANKIVVIKVCRNKLHVHRFRNEVHAALRKYNLRERKFRKLIGFPDALLIFFVRAKIEHFSVLVIRFMQLRGLRQAHAAAHAAALRIISFNTGARYS